MCSKFGADSRTAIVRHCDGLISSWEFNWLWWSKHSKSVVEEYISEIRQNRLWRALGEKETLNWRCLCLKHHFRLLSTKRFKSRQNFLVASKSKKNSNSNGSYLMLSKSGFRIFVSAFQRRLHHFDIFEPILGQKLTTGGGYSTRGLKPPVYYSGIVVSCLSFFCLFRVAHRAWMTYQVVNKFV
jgi:hypothetical protein